MSEQPAAYGGERPVLPVECHEALERQEDRIATLEAALLRTWYDAGSDICTVCEHTQHMETSSSGHTPDCIIPSIERQAPTS